MCLLGLGLSLRAQKEQIINDLAAYSPVNELLEIEFEGYQARTDFLGLAKASATYRQGLGCTLDYPDSQQILDGLAVEDIKPNQGQWPKGEKVSTIRADIQTVADQILAQDLALGFDTRALLVVQNGQIVAESYQTGVTSSTLLLGWSMAKSISAIFIGHLAQKGLVELGATHLFPAWQNDERANISLENLLQMNSGLAFDETYLPGADATKMLFVDSNAAELAMSMPLTSAVGETFSYSSGTSNLLMAYAFDALGRDQQAMLDVFYQGIVKPLGLANTIFELDGNGVMIGSSYILATARDWARLGLLMINKGKVNGHPIVSKDWIQMATKPNKSSNEKSYGYQFWLNAGDKELRWPKLPKDTYAMLGSKKQRVMMFPSQNAVVVRLGWSSTYPDDENFAAIIEALDNLNPTYGLRSNK